MPRNNPSSHGNPLTTLTLLTLVTGLLLLAACDRTPRGVMSVNKMADLIADLQIADAYIESHIGEFESDSSKQVIKQSVFKKHGITQQDYDSSLVWYAHNMEDYTKAHDKAVGKLKARLEKVNKDNGNSNATAGEMMAEGTMQGAPTHEAVPAKANIGPRGPKPTGVNANTADLWKGSRNYTLTQGARHGFITFDIPADAGYERGDRYQLAYKLTRGGNDFKVSLNVDYTDGATSQMTRGNNSDGWVTMDIQSDTARRVRRIYGYVSYDIKRGRTAYVDSMMLLRTHLDKSNYGFINAQRLLQRRK